MKKSYLLKYRYNTNAITLITLVIIIILLLILAGVTLSLTFGKNGIFMLSKNARK